MSYVILGAGGLAREVRDALIEVNDFFCSVPGLYEMIEAMVVDDEWYKEGQLVNLIPVRNWDWLKKSKDGVVCVPGLGVPEVRKKMVEHALEIGARFTSVIHPSVRRSAFSKVGIGVFIGCNCSLMPQTVIGDFCMMNLHSVLGHDSVMENYATTGIGTLIPGYAKLEEGCLVGSGVQMLSKIVVGKWSRVGAGSVIVESVPPNTTVVGNPGKVVRTRKEGWQEEFIK